MAEQAYNVTKSDGKKSRRTITYNDVAKAVSSIDNLEFLQDLIPETQTYGAYKAKKAAKAKATSLQNGQTTLDGKRAQPQVLAPTGGNIEEMEGIDASDQAGPSTRGGDGDAEPAQEPAQQYTFEHYEGPNGSGRRDESGDVEMS